MYQFTFFYNLFDERKTKSQNCKSVYCECLRNLILRLAYTKAIRMQALALFKEVVYCIFLYASNLYKSKYDRDTHS